MSGFFKKQTNINLSEHSDISLQLDLPWFSVFREILVRSYFIQCWVCWQAPLQWGSGLDLWCVLQILHNLSILFWYDQLNIKEALQRCK